MNDRLAIIIHSATKVTLTPILSHGLAGCMAGTRYNWHETAYQNADTVEKHVLGKIRKFYEKNMYLVGKLRVLKRSGSKMIFSGILGTSGCLQEETLNYASSSS